MSAIADVQSSHDLRNLPTDRVGIKGPRFPITLNTTEGSQSTVAHLTMTVFLPADQRGTHMPRFVALMEQQTRALDPDRLHKLTAKMVTLLGSHPGKTSASFPFFCKKSAPASGTQSLPDYGATPTNEIKNGTYSRNPKVMVPVTSLCPCSKEISQYGAHSQRSRVTVSLTANTEAGTEEIADCMEARANCQPYDLLRRPGEKYVTEKAYENPKLVEDMVHDVATALIVDGYIKSFIVESENFELIHNHSAYVYTAYP